MEDTASAMRDAAALFGADCTNSFDLERAVWRRCPQVKASPSLPGFRRIPRTGSRGTPNANQVDHLHISVYGNRGTA